MKLDQSKPFANIYGHHSATYEQQGCLYDGGGNLILVETPTESRTEDYSSVDFLRELLDGSPMSRKKVSEVAEQAGIAWFDVENAALELKVERRKQGFGEIWKLNA